MMEGTAEEQNTILNELQALGYNVVECPGGDKPCGVELLVRNTVGTYKCFICDAEFDSLECSDLVFPDKNNHGYFANT
jgi:peptide methionine sulfoxide reductase MsrB